MKRDRMYRRALKSRHLWDEYKYLRNSCSKLFYSKKSLYFKSFISSVTTSSRKLWKKLLPYITPNKRTILLSALILNNTDLNSDVDLANAFCNYFATITVAFNFLTLSVCLSYVDNFFMTNILFKSFNNIPKFKLKLLTKDEVVEGMKSLAVNSGVGEVGIESIIFSACADELGLVITNLFNLIISSGVYPDEWKCAHITPLYKGKGSKSSLENYRPISILPPISKLFESLISKQIYTHFESNKLLHPSQFGFRQKMSCEIALNSLTEDWRGWLDDNKDVVSVFLDLSKAFDTVDHNILLKKLEYYSVNNTTLSLIKNYLTNRSIKINVNGKLSNSKPLSIGVPQGSVLGPLLFIIFVNDMCYLDLNSKVILFADDTTLSTFGTSPGDIITKIEEDLDVISNWLKHNRLIINLSKTQAMYISHLQKKSKAYKEELAKLTLNCNNTQISFVNEVKILGIFVDNQFKFDGQAANICKKVNAKTFLLRKSLYLFPDSFKPQLFKIFIQPHFDYCSTLIIYFSNKANLERINNCFSKSLKRILKLKKNFFLLSLSKQHEFLKSYNILPFLYRQFFQYSTFIFNLCKNKNTALSEIFVHDVNSRTTSGYKLPRYKSDFKKYSFHIISINLLNLFIHKFLTSDSNINIFKKHLHENLVKLYADSIRFWT
jgi:hypothetical protein